MICKYYIPKNAPSGGGNPEKENRKGNIITRQICSDFAIFVFRECNQRLLGMRLTDSYNTFDG